MNSRICPFCKKQIQPEAAVCGHCHAQVRRSRAEMMIAAVTSTYSAYLARVEIISLPTECEGWCAYLWRSDNANKEHCVTDCKLASQAATLAAQLHRQLYRTFVEVLWVRGNIDPLPDLERLTRERFANQTIPG